LALVDRLDGRTRRRAGGAVLVVLVALIVHNVPTALRNQRELPRDAVDEMDDWFAVSSRDLEHVASANPRHTVFGRLAIFHFLAQRIGGSTLTIPEWWAWNRWELERVAHLHVEVAAEPPMIPDEVARTLRHAERRRFQPRSSKAPKITDLFLHREPGADRYVLVQAAQGRRDFFILTEEHYARLLAGEAAP
jgi:hypothetical protein